MSLILLSILNSMCEERKCSFNSYVLEAVCLKRVSFDLLFSHSQPFIFSSFFVSSAQFSCLLFGVYIFSCVRWYLP